MTSKSLDLASISPLEVCILPIKKRIDNIQTMSKPAVHPKYRISAAAHRSYFLHVVSSPPNDETSMRKTANFFVGVFAVSPKGGKEIYRKKVKNRL